MSEALDITTVEQRVELAARALARHRLTHNEVWQNATELRQEMLDRAIDNLWRQLLPEARAVVTALEAAQAGQNAPADQDTLAET